MKRTGFKRRTSQRPARSEPFTASVSKAPDVSDTPRVVAGNTASVEMREARVKPLVVVSDKIRESAKGERCTVRLPWCCDGGGETTVYAHLPMPGLPAGYKVTDIAGCFSCRACHAAIDAPGMTRWPDRERDLRRAQTLTLTRLIELGIVEIKGAA